jgi:putative ABC transport system substrate-binding protein
LLAWPQAARDEVKREMPPTTIIAVLLNPNFPDIETQLRDVRGSARALGQPIAILNASSVRDIDTAFAALVQQRAGALSLIFPSTLLGRAER